MGGIGLCCYFMLFLDLHQHSRVVRHHQSAHWLTSVKGPQWTQRHYRQAYDNVTQWPSITGDLSHRLKALGYRGTGNTLASSFRYFTDLVETKCITIEGKTLILRLRNILRNNSGSYSMTPSSTMAQHMTWSQQPEEKHWGFDFSFDSHVYWSSVMGKDCKRCR